MKFAFQALFDFKTISEAVDFAQENGFDGVELGLGNPFLYEEFMNGITESNFPILIHSVEAFDLLTPVDEIRSAGMRWLSRVIDKAEKNGTRTVTIHLGPGIPFAVTGKKIYLQEHFSEHFYHKTEEVLEILSQHSIVAVENVGSFRFPYVRKLIEKYIEKGLKLTWDLGHTFLLKAKRKDEEDFFIKNKKAIANIHVHDNLGIRDEHNVIGEGKIDFREIFSKLDSWDGFMTVEVRPKEAALKSFVRLKKMLS